MIGKIIGNANNSASGMGRHLKLQCAATKTGLSNNTALAMPTSDKSPSSNLLFHILKLQNERSLPQMTEPKI